MMKHEFEERFGSEISDQNYKIIETVYTWHPAIKGVDGKDQIATLYKTGGMPLIKSMLEARKHYDGSGQRKTASNETHGGDPEERLRR
ncbi:MAG: hypothetical protein ACLTC8_10385 [Lachnospiraceae bacterium]